MPRGFLFQGQKKPRQLSLPLHIWRANEHSRSDSSAIRDFAGRARYHAGNTTAQEAVIDQIVAIVHQKWVMSQLFKC